MTDSIQSYDIKNTCTLKSNFCRKKVIILSLCTHFCYSPRASNRFNQVDEAKRFEGVFLYRKVC